MDERTSLSDGVLVLQVRAGQVEQFAVLVERYRAEFGRYAAAVCGDSDTAADALQEAFIKAFGALASCDPDKFKAWFFRILRNQCSDLRRRWRRQVPLELADRPARERADDGLRCSEIRRALDAALEALTPEQREAFVMKHIEGRSYGEMAELLETGEDALKMRVYRAREIVKEQLEAY
jgi:RNA polymerase sigma-70 factor (ECF subfamily)